MHKSAVILLDLAPLALGALISKLPTSHLFLGPYFERYATLIIAVLSWYVLLCYVPTFAAASKSRFKWLQIPLLLLLLLLALLSLQLFRSKAPISQLYLVLASIGCLALSIMWRMRRRFLLSLALRFAYYTTAGYSTFLLSSAFWFWQAAVAAAALASVLCSALVSHWLCDPLVSALFQSSAAGWKFSLRTCTLLLIGGPFLMVYLCFNGFLEKGYLALLLTLPLISHLAATGRKAEASQSLPCSFEGKVFLNAALYVAILTVLALI